MMFGSEPMGELECMRIFEIKDAKIKSLQAELTTLKQRIAPFDDAAKEYGIDAQTMLALAKSKIAAVKENIELQEQLDEANERLGAAVEDINDMKNFLMSGDECRFCKHQPRVEGVDSCLETCMFEYKGLQGKE